MKEIFSANHFEEKHVLDFLEKNPGHKNKTEILDEPDLYRANNAAKLESMSFSMSREEGFAISKRNLNRVSAIIGSIGRLNELATG